MQSILINSSSLGLIKQGIMIDKVIVLVSFTTLKEKFFEYLKSSYGQNFEEC